MKAGSGASCALRSSVSNIGASPGKIKASPPTRPIARTETPAARALADDLSGVFALRDREEIARLIFSKQRRLSRTRGSSAIGAPVAGERHFRERDGETAIGEIMRGADPRRERIRSRTKSPFLRSAARSTGGDAPSLRPKSSCAIG